jgi:sugar phosphate isomerase/epimerase
MKEPKIGLALYTVEDKLRTGADYPAILRQVKRMGYDGVEWHAIDDLIGIREYARILADEGLVCCSNHSSEQELRGRLDEVIANAKELGNPAIAFAYLEMKHVSAEGIRELAPFLDATGERLREAGIQFMYHNHHMELNKSGGKTLLELLYSLTDRRNVWAELDTYWIQHGGGDPVDWCRRMKGRIRHLHCKDKAMRGDECVFAEVGEGNLDWPRIVKAALDAGVEWFIVEQDSSRRDTLESAEISCKALQAHLGRR